VRKKRTKGREPPPLLQTKKGEEKDEDPGKGRGGKIVVPG